MRALIWLRRLVHTLLLTALLVVLLAVYTLLDRAIIMAIIVGMSGVAHAGLWLTQRLEQRVHEQQVREERKAMADHARAALLPADSSRPLRGRGTD